ncbi:MAG: hypothetical protein ACE37H_15660 [Phycisphaeraceae bacterium]
MPDRTRRLTTTRSLLPALCLLAMPAGGVDINWDGNTNDPAAPFGDNLNWSSDGNWDTDLSPNAAGTNVFIGANPGYPDEVTVLQNVATVTVHGLTLGQGSRLRLASGTDLQVLNTAQIDGTIYGQGGDLTATSNGGTTAVLGDGAKLWAENGSIVSIDAASYQATTLSFDHTLLWANGAGSSVLLPGLTTIDASPPGGLVELKIEALNGGHIDLSGVTTITGPQSSSSKLLIYADSAGTINLRWVGDDHHRQRPDRYLVKRCRLGHQPAVGNQPDTHGAVRRWRRRGNRHGRFALDLFSGWPYVRPHADVGQRRRLEPVAAQPDDDRRLGDRRPDRFQDRSDQRRPHRPVGCDHHHRPAVQLEQTADLRRQ